MGKGKLTVKKGDEDYEGDWIEVLEKVVGGAVQSHIAGLRDEVVPDLNPADEVEREKEKYLIHGKG